MWENTSRWGVRMTLAEEYQAISVETLRLYLEERQDEHLHLDFKLVDDPQFSKRPDRRNFAIAASGFANADGGILVWGVDARRDGEGVDRVVALPGVRDASRLVSSLNHYTAQAVNPTVDGIQHRVIGGVSREAEQFVATLVPSSDGGPYMAKLGEDRYYKRSGDSFLVMEHYEVADMFGRRRRPVLEFVAEARGSEIIVGVRNKGRASAHAPYLSVYSAPPFHRSIYGVDGNRGEGLKYLPAQSRWNTWRFGGSGDVIVHPGVTLEVALLTSNNNVTPIHSEGVLIRYAIACDGQALIEGECTIPTEELRR